MCIKKNSLSISLEIYFSNEKIVSNELMLLSPYIPFLLKLPKELEDYLRKNFPFSIKKSFYYPFSKFVTRNLKNIIYRETFSE